MCGNMEISWKPRFHELQHDESNTHSHSSERQGREPDKGRQTRKRKARVRFLLSLFRVCVVAPSVRSRGFVLAGVSDHAILPTSERLAVVARRFEIGV